MRSVVKVVTFTFLLQNRSDIFPYVCNCLRFWFRSGLHKCNEGRFNINQVFFPILKDIQRYFYLWITV